MKVIGAGFGRTGTASLKAALERLGFGPCYHMLEVFENPSHLRLWEAAAAGEPVEWDEVFKHYEAAVDWPVAAFYEQLMEAYPEAKVVLTVRDPEKWYESTRSTIYRINRVTSLPFFSVVGLFAPEPRRVSKMVNKVVWRDTFGSEFENKRRAIEVFKRHNEEVRRKVPPEKLLVYEVGEGWGPLCEFLGVEVPENEPFPHINDTASFRKRSQRRMMLALGASGSAMLLAGLVLVIFSRRLRRHPRGPAARFWTTLLDLWRL